MRNPEREVHYFRLRVLVAMAFVLVLLHAAGRALCLAAGGEARGLSGAGRAEPHRRAAGGAESRSDQGPLRPHHRPQLLRLYARDHAGQGREPGGDDRRAGAGDRGAGARPPPLPQADGGHQALRFGADPHSADRRGSRPLRGAALPLSRSRTARPPVPRLPARCDRLAHAGIHRPHLAARSRAHRGDGGSGGVSRHRAHRQARHRTEIRGGTARHDRLRRGRDHGRWPRGAHAEAHAVAARQQPDAFDRHRAAAGRRKGLRQASWRADRDRTGDRGRAGLRIDAQFRPQPVRRRHRPEALGRTQRRPRQTAAEPRTARDLSDRVDLQAVPGDGGTAYGQAAARAGDPGQRHLRVRQSHIPRFEQGAAGCREHARVDRQVERHLLLHARQ